MARTLHGFVRLFAGALVLMVVLLALAAARLAAGPVALQFATPLIEHALDTATPWRFSVGDAGVLWRDWRQGLLVRLANVEAFDDTGASIAHIGALAVAFSPQAMTHRVLAPTSIEAETVRLILPGGEIARLPVPSSAPSPAIVEGEPREGDTIAAVLAGLRSQPTPTRPLSYLLDAKLSDVSIAQKDPPAANAKPGTSWSTRIGEARFVRNGDALVGTADAALAHDGETATITLGLETAADRNETDGTLTVARLRPAAFASLLPELAPLAALDVPLQGRMTFTVADDGNLDTIVAAISGGTGFLSLDAEVLGAMHLPIAAAQRLAVSSLALRASMSGAAAGIDVQSASINFSPRTQIYLPEPVDFHLPLASLTASGTYASASLRDGHLDLDLAGQKLTATASIDGLDAVPAGTVALRMSAVKVADFRRYWPPKLASGAYEWCIEHLRDGFVPEARARIDLVARDGATQIAALDAQFGIERLTVDYLPPMPPVRDARGTARADLNSLRIAVTGGRADGLAVRQGTIVFPDIDRDVSSIDIDIVVDGPVRDAMQLIAHEPLAYPQKIGIRPDQTSGETSARVRLAFPLLADLDADQIDIQATADLRDLGVTDIIPGFKPRVDLSHGNGHLDINGDGMTATGHLAVADIETKFALSQSFVDDAEPQSRLEVEAPEVPVERLRKSVPKATKLSEYLLDGALAGKAVLVISRGGDGHIDTTIDASRAAVAIPELGWSKAAGPMGTVTANIETTADRIAAVPRLTILAPGLDVSGVLRFDADNNIDRIDISHLIAGRTNATGTIGRLEGDGWEVTVSGASIDLGPLIDVEAKSSDDEAAGARVWPGLVLTADLDRVWFDDNDPILAVKATVIHQDGKWSPVQLEGSLADANPLALSITPTDGEGRLLTVNAENAGAALRAFGLFSDMTGGRLDAKGRFDDSQADHPLKGRLRVTDFYLVNMPVLARLLGVLALTGIRDALTGRGIHFSTFDMPFQARARAIDITDAKAFGAALGITASGNVDTGNDTVDMQGELVPFYAVNAAFGRLPLIGGALTGGESGGGVFSASYSVTGSLAEPAVSVNPISVLFPGFLRWILSTFEGWVTTEASTIADEPPESTTP
ncbi:MAG: hypothetical protein IPK66_16925 [Rhodospirillales bacterium]|nr:hypothetical protein [Rhodospirillales bacterium]